MGRSGDRTPGSSTAGASGSHADLTGVTSDQHHAKSHAHDGADGSGTVAHSAVTGVSANQHHNQSHTDSDHSDGANVKKATVTAKGSLYAATASATVAELAAGTNGKTLVADSAQTAGLKWGVFPGAFLVFLRSGLYYPTLPAQATTTSATLGNGTLRLAPFFVPRDVTITRIGAEVTSNGDTGSHLRLGIYNDDGTGYPGTLVLDAGTILGDSATFQEITISQALTAGMYWAGGAVQDVTTTQPTVRTPNNVVAITGQTATPGAGTASFAYSQTSVTGALPSPFSATVTATNGCPRIWVKVA